MKRVFIDSAYMHPLVRASIVRNDVENLKMLHENKKNLYALDKNGLSALLIAADSGAIDVFKYLVNLGLDTEYCAPNGTSLADYLDNPEIEAVLNEIFVPEPDGEEVDDLLGIDWEPEEEFVPIQQKPSDVENIVEFQDMLSEMEIADTDLDWDSSWIELPAYVELRDGFVSNHSFADALKRIFWIQKSDFSLLEKLVPESEMLLESLQIALSCCGIALSNETIMPDYVLDEEFDQLEYEEFIRNLDSIIYEEMKYINFPLYRIYEGFANLKKKSFRDTSLLFSDIDREFSKIIQLLLQSKEAMTLLLALYCFQGNDWKSEDVDQLFWHSPDLVHNSTQTSHQDSSNILDDDVESDEGFEEYDANSNCFRPCYSLGKNLFEDCSYSQKQVATMLKKLGNEKIPSEQAVNEISNFIKKTTPTTFCFERICFELELRRPNTDFVDQVVACLRTIQNDRYDIALQNYGLLIFVMKKTYVSEISPEEILQEGFFGLVRATEKFDPKLGIKFSTYAVNWIRQTMVRYRDDHFSVIRYPTYFSTLNYKYRKIKSEYSNRDQELPPIGELAELLEVSEKTIEGLEENFHEFISYEEIRENDNNTCDSDDEYSVGKEDALIEDALIVWTDFDSALIEENLHEQIQEIISEFHPRLKDIVNKRFGMDGNESMTLEELGSQYDVTRERIRQIEAKALRKLREIPRYYNSLKDYLY
nr:sigma-70 family RNA polymerase sigma factor [uncultured Sphaerochaeta sp.]